MQIEYPQVLLRRTTLDKEVFYLFIDPIYKYEVRYNIALEELYTLLSHQDNVYCCYHTYESYNSDSDNDKLFGDKCVFVEINTLISYDELSQFLRELNKFVYMILVCQR